MKLAIIGSGIVGRATGIGLSMQGNNVTFFDIDGEKLSALRKEGFKVAQDMKEVILDSDVSFVCVPTPSINGRMDLNCVENVSTSIAQTLRNINGYHIVVIRSTVLPSTTRLRIVPLLEKISQLRAGIDFGVCVNPEFLREANALEDFLKPFRIVIGELDERSGDLLEKLYSPFKVPVIKTDLDTAEMIKYVANSFLATKISFFNEICILCKELGLDPHIVSKAVSMDSRIGTYGIDGGRPYGGKCLPKDVEAFINFVESQKLNPKILKAAYLVNEKMVQRRNGEA